MKPEKQKAARELRANGLTLSEIAKQLNVAKSSVSMWCRNIELSQDQIENINQRAKYKIYENQLKGAQKRKKEAEAKRLEYQKEGKNKAKEQSPLHIAGCMLYWGEGSKSRCTCSLTNTDINLLRLFIMFLNKELGVKKDSLIVTVNCFTNNGLSLEEIEKYWLDNLDLPHSCLRKSRVNLPSKVSQFKKNKHKYGTCRISYHSTKVVQHIYGAIQAYGKFHNNFCLNARS